MCQPLKTDILEAEDKRFRTGEMKDRIPTFVIAKPGCVRDCLQTTLGAIASVEVIWQTGDIPSTLAMLAEHQPALVLLYTDLPKGESWVTILRQIKTDWLQTPCLVLANNAQEQQAARAAGADGALFKGIPASRLFATIERLLPRETI